MLKKFILPTLAAFPTLAMGATPPTIDASELRGMGFVVKYALAPGARDKEGVDARTDADNRLFGPAVLGPKNGGTSTFLAGTRMSFPRWVRVTWREGMTAYLTDNSGHYTTGKVIGDYTVEVLSRLPPEVIAYAKAGRGRMIRLLFKLKDDGVLLAWDVEERVRHPRGGSGFVWSMHGGDFPCETSPHRPRPVCTDGPLEQAPWYNPLWIRE